MDARLPVTVLAARRTEARQRRAFTEADALRDELVHAGIQIEDTAHGTVWHRTHGIPA